MINRPLLTAELQRLVRRVEDDLRDRATVVSEIDEKIVSEWERARLDHRTRLDAGPWREGLLTQVAVAWVLGTVFVRFCEDNSLLPTPVLSGPAERRQQAVDAQTLYFRAHPADGERAYVTHVFTEAARLPGLSEVFGAHNPLWLFGPSDDGVRLIVDYWREIDPDTGALRRPLTSSGWDTRFLGDLYQDLSDAAKKTYALLQTPDFVEEFILDRTLEPALEEFGLEGFRMIDPACGSGHFLLGSFARLFERWMRRAPQDGERAAAQRALQSVHGVDLNPFAVAIARFRLLVAAMAAAGVRTLAEAPNFALRVATGDSLLHGPPPGQQSFRLIDEQDPATLHLFATEDGEAVRRLLEQRYHAVVANPPYITPKDPAANDAYRRRYATCHRQYSLAVPFMERLFDLAEGGAEGRTAGFVGQITANSFMKREFGSKLIEHFLAREVDLTHVIDTSGAYIPGHGTPTVILFGRNRSPVGSTVRAAMGIRGEPSKPADPRKGLVWQAILDGIDQVGFTSDYVSTNDIERTQLAKHPWSLQGGGALATRETMSAVPGRLEAVIEWPIGRAVRIGADDAFVIPRPGVVPPSVRPTVSGYQLGEEVRDWGAQRVAFVLYPYADADLAPLKQFLWSSRTVLSQRATFQGVMADAGRDWFEYMQHTSSAYSTSLSIVFSNVATHNHFALHRGGDVFSSHAPVVKLPVGASEAEHLALVGLLNSSAACFWMKQVFQRKTQAGGGGGAADAEFTHQHEFDGTKLKQFPIPGGSGEPFASLLDGLAQELSRHVPAALVERELPTRASLDEAAVTVEDIRRAMVAFQEELDWRCYFLYGLTEEDLSLDAADVPRIAKGERAFEIALARQVAAGEAETSWFARHGSTPITEMPAHWPDTYRAIVERRLALIESNPHVNLVERPEYKRRWNWESWDMLEQAALCSWLLDRLEAPALWPANQPEIRSVARLADLAGADEAFRSVAQLYKNRPDVDLTALVGELVAEQAVPFLAALRYTDAGLRTRAQWEQTWALQRREDAGEKVGTIPVPPKYGSGDFTSKAVWSLRGKLDVPKERFVSYPGCGRDTDPTLPVGWAGWDHLQQATALAGWYEERRTVDGWSAERLTPILAGIAELVPWLQQWHNDIDPATGQRLGDFFAEFVTTECHSLGIAPDSLAGWRPPQKAGRGRKAKVNV